MVSTQLVDDLIDNGQRVLLRLAEGDFNVTSAAWLKPTDEDRWVLYIASTVVDQKGLAQAYRDAFALIGSDAGATIGISDIVLIGVQHPITRDLVEFRDLSGSDHPIRHPGPQLGGLPIGAAIIYPANARPKVFIATGKEEVLRHLESKSQSLTGTSGEYALGRDWNGNLVAIVAGHTFIGTGTVNFGSGRRTVSDGLVTNISKL